MIQGQFILIDEETKNEGEQCMDGNFYQVVCFDWDHPQNPYYANVDCDGSVGSFEFKDLQTNHEFSCFLRRSEDHETYDSVGQIQIKAPHDEAVDPIFVGTSDVILRVLYDLDRGIKGYVIHKP